MFSNKEICEASRWEGEEEARDAQCRAEEWSFSAGKFSHKYEEERLSVYLYAVNTKIYEYFGCDG